VYSPCVGTFGELKSKMGVIDPLHLEKILVCVYREGIVNSISTEAIEHLILALRTEMEGLV
jgi:hypothetical protein